MKRIFLLLSIVVTLLLINGCATEISSTNHDTTQEYGKFTLQFQDSYSKCTFTTVYVDGEELAEYFKTDLHEYDGITEVFIDELQGHMKKSFSDKKINYAWNQEDEGNACINFYGPLSDEEYDTSLKRVREYMDSLDYNLEIWNLNESDGVSECTYRQVIDGIPISAIQSKLPYVIYADVGKASGIQIGFFTVIDEIHPIVSYDTKDFIPLNVVIEILEQYMKQGGGSIYGESIIVETTIQEVEIVYFFAEEGGQYVLKPVYEIDVVEDNGRAKLEATYIVDVLTGYVECRCNDFSR